jgi:hypothetical protein
MSDRMLKRVLNYNWQRCHFMSPDAKEALPELFRRAGYVSDNGRKLSGDLVIYRGDLGDGDDLDDWGNPIGLSWTLSIDVARKFAGRAALFSSDAGCKATVWEARVKAEDILGCFTGEQEIVVDPGDLTGVLKIEELSWKKTSDPYAPRLSRRNVQTQRKETNHGQTSIQT